MPIPDGIDGRSLKPLLEGGTVPDEPAYMEAVGVKLEGNFLGKDEEFKQLVRIRAGHHHMSRRSPGGAWTDPYTTSGFFFAWLAGPGGLQTDGRQAGDGSESGVGPQGGGSKYEVLSRIGKVAAATTATALIERFAVDRILFTGVAGGIAPGVQRGDGRGDGRPECGVGRVEVAAGPQEFAVGGGVRGELGADERAVEREARLHVERVVHGGRREPGRVHHREVRVRISAIALLEVRQRKPHGRGRGPGDRP